MGEEQRRHRRVEIRLPVSIQALDGGGTSVDGTIVNLGPEGAFCESDSCLPQGTAVSVSFRLAEMDESVSSEGEVRWITKGPGTRGMGIAFLGIAEEKKDAIYRFILIKMVEARRGG